MAGGKRKSEAKVSVGRASKGRLGQMGDKLRTCQIHHQHHQDLVKHQAFCVSYGAALRNLAQQHPQPSIANQQRRHPPGIIHHPAFSSASPPSHIPLVRHLSCIIRISPPFPATRPFRSPGPVERPRITRARSIDDRPQSIHPASLLRLDSAAGPGPDPLWPWPRL